MAANVQEDQTKSKGAMLWNMGNIQANNMSIQWIRSFMSVAGGSMVGILGLTGSRGFLCFFVLSVIINFGILAKAKFQIADYIPGNKFPNFLVDGLLGELLSFLLFWTLFYGLVHVY
jgi:ER membrane protein complex subunit 6